MADPDCAGRWSFYNFDRVAQSLDEAIDPPREKILESLFRIMEHPHDPRGVIWFEQRVGYLRGARVAVLAEDWFLTYDFYDSSPVGECAIYVYALGRVPPK